MEKIMMAYGRDKVEVPLEGMNVLDVLQVAEVQPLANPLGTLLDALASPISSPPLKEIVKPGDKVAVVVNDDTRVANTSFFLPHLLGAVEEAGAAREDLTIVFANGTHRLLPVETQKELIGEKVFNNYKVINHDCRDKEQLVYVGTTSRGNRVELNRHVAEADKVILTGSIVYHFFAGYGGGRKALVPGVAGYETILFNHRLMLEEGAELARLDGNPVHEDLMEAVSFKRPDFLLNVVLNANKEFLGIYAGDYVEAHREGCKMVDRAYGVPIGEAADLVIASCGGHPKDINIYQAQKPLDNAIRAVRPGGAVILLAACPEGLGSPALEEWLNKYRTPEEISNAVRKNFVIGGHKAYALTRLTEKAKIIAVTGLPAETVKKMHYVPAADPAEAIRLALEHLGSARPTVYLMPQGSLTLPLMRS